MIDFRRIFGPVETMPMSPCFRAMRVGSLLITQGAMLRLCGPHPTHCLLVFRKLNWLGRWWYARRMR